MAVILLFLALCVPTIVSAQPAPVTPAAAGGALTDAQLAARLPLPVLATIDPTGLATGLGQTAGNLSLASIDTKLTSPLSVNFTNTTLAVTGTFFQATQPISATSLPLPALAATSTIQATQQTALDAIKIDVDKIPSPGQALAAGSLPVVLTAIQQTALTPPAAITGFGLESTQLLQATAGKQDTGNTSLSSIDTKLTNPLPVSLPAATVTTLTPPAAITGFALESSQLTGNGSLASVKTNTDPLVASGAGGYVRQDSTATIAKESGGNLASMKTALDTLNAAVATATNQATELAYLATLAGAVLTRSAVTPSTPALVVQMANFGPPLPLPLCNAVRRYNCQPRTW